MQPDIAEVLNSWIVLLTAVGGILAALWRRHLVHGWIRIRDAVGGFLAMVDAFPALVEDIQSVKKEVAYNGGSSSKDMLRKLVINVDYLMADNKISTFSSDAQGMVTRISDRAVESLRCQRDDLLGVGWRSFVQPEEIDKVSTAWASIVRDGRSARIDGVTLLTDRGPVKIDIEVIALRDGEGRFTGHNGFIRTAP